MHPPQGATALGDHQQITVSLFLPDDRIEFTREIRPAPFARSGLHVEIEERVPDAFGQVGAGQPVNGDAGCQRVGALATNGLALTRGQRGEEILERRIASVLPVELAVGAAQIAVLAEKLPFGFGQERHVDGGGLGAAADLGQPARQRFANRFSLRTRTHEEAPAGRRRERHGHLELRIVIAAGPFVGVGPAVIENVFALRMRFCVTGRRAEKLAARIFDQQMHGLPAGTLPSRAGFFKRR